MSILQRIRSDLDRGLLEHRAKVLLEVLRQRLGELTLGDLREILASKLGEGLAALKIAELTGGTGEAKAALPRATRGKPGKQAKAGKAKAGAKQAGAKQAGAKQAGAKKAGAKKASAGTFGAELLEKVWHTLHAAGVPMTSGELRAALGGSKATMYRAVRELVRAGKLATAGKPARYSVKAGEARTEAAAPADANATAEAGEQPADKKTAKKAGAKKAAGKKAGAKKAAGKKAGKKAAGKKTAAKKAAGKKTAKTAGAKKAGAKKAAKAEAAKAEPASAAEVSARTTEGRTQYDEALLAALRTAGDWVGATRLREAIGGSDNQVRIALRRLIDEGKVARRGERNATEYRLGG